MKLLLSLTLATALTFSAFVTPVNADTASQELQTSTSTKVECKSGAYGQDLNCTATADATASGKQNLVVRKDGTVLSAHTPVDAALDAKSLMVIGSLLAVGAVAFTYSVVSKA